MPESYRYLRVRLQIEQQRFLNFGLESGILYADGVICAALQVNRSLLLAVLAEIKAVFETYATANGKYEKTMPQDVVDWTDPHWAAEGGESLAQLHGRVAGHLAGLRADPPADVVALVTHGDTIRALQAVVAGLGPDQLPAVTPHNGSVTRLELP